MTYMEFFKYARARAKEPSSWAAVGWFFGFLAWSDTFGTVAHGLLMIFGGSITLIGAFIPDPSKPPR